MRRSVSFFGFRVDPEYMLILGNHLRGKYLFAVEWKLLGGRAALACGPQQICSQELIFLAIGVQLVFGLGETVPLVWIAEIDEGLVVLFECGDQLIGFIGWHLRIFFAPENQQRGFNFRDVWH